MTDAKVERKDLEEIQGLIIRGYHMRHACYFVLEVKDAAAAKSFLREIAPSITTAQEWNQKPEFCLNIGFTYEGLNRLGMTEECKYLENERTFAPFVEGAVARAEVIGDVGQSAPANWIAELRESGRVHVLLALYANELAYTKRVKELKAWFTKNGAFAELCRQEGTELPGGVVHFGYRDGIAQPAIDLDSSGTTSKRNGGQPSVPAGAFLLGYPSQWQDYTYPIPSSYKFGRNGSFAAFRILQQHVDRFEASLNDQAAKTGMDKELIAAKMCGRWRNGKPLILAPVPDENVHENQINDFDYSADPKGHICPFGAHIRRANPRNDPLAVSNGSKRPILRRGIPYGPPYNADKPDKEERGLLGFFICIDLGGQFEFIMKEWINQGGSSGHLRMSDKDPLVGPSNFTIPGPQGRTQLELSEFVTTRGSLYCFLPSVTGLRYIAGQV